MSGKYNISDEAIDDASDSLTILSQEIWKRPELCYEETFAHKLLTNYLKTNGFEVDCGYKDIKTAFRASYGPDEGRPNVVIFCEYDALPEIGHGCGHNLIAELGVAAGIGVKAAVEADNGATGKVTIIGSPAEEGGGGKIKLMNAGALEGVDVALMSHPAGYSTLRPKTLANYRLAVKYTGKASHASASPWAGVNALDAAVLCYQNIACLRQQLKPMWQIHGVITKGGVKANIIPETTESQYMIRATTAKDLLTVRKKVLACVKAAAQATGCTVNVSKQNPPYLNVIQNETLVSCYAKHLDTLGVPDKGFEFTGASTDMGNVSYSVPSIHPSFGIGNGAYNHTREFREASGALDAQGRTLIEAKALARLALDILYDDDLLQKVKRTFEQDISVHSSEEVTELVNGLQD